MVIVVIVKFVYGSFYVLLFLLLRYFYFIFILPLVWFILVPGLFTLRWLLVKFICVAFAARVWFAFCPGCWLYLVVTLLLLLPLLPCGSVGSLLFVVIFIAVVRALRVGCVTFTLPFTFRFFAFLRWLVVALRAPHGRLRVCRLFGLVGWLRVYFYLVVGYYLCCRVCLAVRWLVPFGAPLPLRDLRWFFALPYGWFFLLPFITLFCVYLVLLVPHGSLVPWFMVGLNLRLLVYCYGSPYLAALVLYAFCVYGLRTGSPSPYAVYLFD